LGRIVRDHDGTKRNGRRYKEKKAQHSVSASVAAIIISIAVVIFGLLAVAIWINVRFRIEVDKVGDLFKTVGWPAAVLIVGLAIIYSPFASRLASINFAGLALKLREAQRKLDEAEAKAEDVTEKAEELWRRLLDTRHRRTSLKALYTLHCFREERRELRYTNTDAYLCRELEYSIDVTFATLCTPADPGAATS
jgi:hypothetical protein